MTAIALEIRENDNGPRWCVNTDRRPDPLTRSRRGGASHEGYPHPIPCRPVPRMTRTHGMAGTPMYVLWTAMIQRCHNPNHQRYADYGGRGITVCDEWRLSFTAFYAYVGDRPDGMTLDRIDNDRGYEPGNVRWATWAEQRANRRASVHPESRKTHCPQDHPYDESNTYYAPKTGYRSCKACQQINQKRRRAQKRGTPDE